MFDKSLIITGYKGNVVIIIFFIILYNFLRQYYHFIQDLDAKQYSRQGKFLLYWMTTTSISTLTSFTATRSRQIPQCQYRFFATFNNVLFSAPWVPWHAPQAVMGSACVERGNSLFGSLFSLLLIRPSGYKWPHPVREKEVIFCQLSGWIFVQSQ